jgi:hypothetical protein
MLLCTSSYFLVLPRTPFVLPCTSSYFLVLPRTSCYSLVLPRTPFVLREYGSLAFSPLSSVHV